MNNILITILLSITGLFIVAGFITQLIIWNKLKRLSKVWEENR